MHRRSVLNSSDSGSNLLANTNSSHSNDLSTSSTTLSKPIDSKMATMGISSSRDRTSEFHQTIRAFQSRMNTPSPPTTATKAKQNLENRSKFMLIAKKIGKDLTNTCIKLEKLTDLAKKRSLFDDKPKEIQDLTFSIKQDINNLHSEISRLQEFVKTTKENDKKNMQKHSSNVVYTLQSKLANVSKDFKHVLEVRNENLKHQSERGEQYFSKKTLDPSSAASMFAPPKMPGSTMGKSVLLYDGQATSGLANGAVKPSGASDETVLNMDLIQKQQMQKRLIINEEESYIRDRANAMQTVESTIVELGTMFNQLATMIKEQEEQIQRIDSNIEDVDINVSEAHTELLKYFQSVTSNRWLMIKIFFVLIVFFVVFIVVMT